MGIEHRPIVRNVSLDDNPEYCGYCAMGCQQGCKRSAMKTWLQDASDAGARAVVGTHADKILVEDGKATGVAATSRTPTARPRRSRSRRRRSWSRAAAVESPALLLRSGIGGPATGKNLRLHPAYLVMGAYDEPVEGWKGQIQSLVSDQLRRPRGRLRLPGRGHRHVPGAARARATPGRAGPPQAVDARLRWHAPFITVARDHGSGEVVLDDLGRAVVRWGLDDEIDRGWPCARTWSSPGCTTPRAPRRSSPATPAASALAPGRGLRRLPRAGRGARRTGRRRGLLHRAPDGRLPDGLRPRRPRWPTAAGSCTTRRASGSATRRRSRPRPA